MAAAQLSSRERVNRMFARQDHDRVPRHESFWAETIERWKGEGLIGDARTVLDMLGSDFHSLNWCWPCAFPGEEVTVEEDEETRVVRDGQGKTVRYWKHKAGTPEHIGFDCDSREKWEKIYKPALLENAIQTDPEAVKRAYRKGRERGKWCHLTGVETFEETRSLIGDELTAIALAEDPEWIVDVSRTFTNVLLRNFDLIMSTGIEPDGMWIYGDMAFNHATFCSPEMYRQYIWPDHKRLADWAHAHGMKLIYHTDGNVNAVIDLWIEAGFDCFQPIEAKAGMDIRRLAPKYGDRLAFFGNIDVMLMASNDLERIEQEIKSKFAAGMATKGYIYHSDHSVPPRVSWETYRAIIRMVEKYGTYA
jgi:uroporphyrinogen decarboxylase